MDLAMEILSSPLGQAVITLVTAGLIALVATVIKLFGRMSSVEGKLELLIGMVDKVLEDKPAGIARMRARRPDKGMKRRE